MIEQRTTRAVGLGSSVRTAVPFSAVLALAGLLLTLVFAPYDVMGRNLWGDEAFTASYTFHGSLGEVFTDIRKNEETPPLYFLLIYGWAQLFGSGEVALRAFSLLCGASAVVVFALFVATRLSRPAATVAVATLALAPLYLIYFAEARAYATTVLAIVLCMWAFERLRAEPAGRGRRVAYALSAAACFLTSYITVALLAAHWLIWLFELRVSAGRRERLTAWALVWGLVWLISLPWLPSLYYQVAIAPEVTSPSDTNLLAYYPRYLAMLMGHPLEWPLMLVWMAGASAGYVLALMGALVPSPRRGLAIRGFAIPLLGLAVLLNALGLLWAKYGIMLVPCLALAIGVGFELLLSRRRLVALSLSGLLLGTMVLANLSRYPYPNDRDWSETAAIIAEQVRPGDVIIMGWPADQRVFEYYYRGPEVRLVGARNFDDFYVGTGHSYKEGWRAEEIVANAAGHRRMWLIKEHYYSDFDAPISFPLTRQWDLGRIEVKLFEVTGQ